MSPRQLLADRDLGGFLRRHRAAIGLLLGTLTLAAVVAILAYGQAQNRRAIRVGCVLLDNAIVQGTNDQAAPLLIGEIVRLAVEHHHRVFVVKFREISSRPPDLRPVDCRQVADHPDEVRAIPVVPPPPMVPLEYGGRG